MSRENQIIVGLDIGTSKIACIVAEAAADGRIDIVGIGTHPSKGLRRGVVVNIESTVESIRLAIEEAELMADVDIKKVYVGIAGSHIRGYNSHGVVATKNGEVTEEDVTRVVEAAKAMNIPADQQILHVLPQEYIIDRQDGIREPVGMSGVRLETRVHVITGAVSSAQNIIKCCNRCDLDVADMVLEQIASSESVLSQDEKDIGVLLVDIGGGTTDLAVFIDGAIRHTAVIPVGGDHMTNDLVAGLRTSAREADILKKKYGSCMTSMISAEETVEVPRVGGRPPQSMPRQVMAQLLEPRMQELFELVREELDRSGYKELVAAGVVLTGGSSLLEGTQELADEIFELPVRIGRPQNIGGLVDVVSSPIYATGVGLIQYGYRYRNEQACRNDEKRSGGSIFANLRRWFGG
ncbi:MAG TPA: cell division protein FtsA [Mariprofundaceae bacterium]|nr:cell division protein FtsA [Mariprofundaceae bacterium]